MYIQSTYQTHPATATRVIPRRRQRNGHHMHLFRLSHRRAKRSVFTVLPRFRFSRVASVVFIDTFSHYKLFVAWCVYVFFFIRFLFAFLYSVSQLFAVFMKSMQKEVNTRKNNNK